MAIYHLHAKIIQRSKGQNIIAASSYRRATKLHDQKEARHWDFSAKRNVIHTEILIPAHSPIWIQELAVLHNEHPSQAAEQLWNALDAAEKRKDAQLAREIEFALPMELTQEQNIGLAREFIQDQFVSRGMIADWSVHWDKGNPHVHVLLTMRDLTATGFGARVLAWNNRDLLYTWREKWAEYANFHLHCHHHNIKIDHRSYEAQGIELIPGIHQGNAAKVKTPSGKEADRLQEANRIKQLNLRRLSENSEIIFQQLSHTNETFTDAHITNLLGRYVDASTRAFWQKHSSDESSSKTAFKVESARANALTPELIEKILQTISRHESVFTEKDIAKTLEAFQDEQANTFAKVVSAIKHSPSLIHLGMGEDGREHFTTRKLFDAENQIQQFADELRERWHRRLPEEKKHTLLANYQTQIKKSLTDEQKIALDHLIKPHAIACLVGRAGTGKSFCLGAAKALWESQNVAVYGIALSGIAADGLNQSIGLASTTIASFCYRVENQLLKLNPHDVVIMDEAGMTDSLSMVSVLTIIHKANAKLVLVGDPAQLQPIGPGATFRALMERLGYVELQKVYRQSIPWQQQATVDFSCGETAKGLAAYKTQNAIHFEATVDAAMQRLVNDWQKVCHEISDLSQVLVVAHRNEDIQALNMHLRASRIQFRKLNLGYRVKTAQGDIHIAVGDRLLFLKNDRSLGVSNGRFATVASLDVVQSEKVLSFSVKLDGSEQKIIINPFAYANFTYGYAATIHKTQGITIDQSFVYVGGKGWNQHLTYVALSRHRQHCQVYADRETHVNYGVLARRLSRLGLKDSVLDFPLAFAERRGIDPQPMHQKLTTHLAKKLTTWKKHLTDKMTQWISFNAVIKEKQVEIQTEIQQANTKTPLSSESITRHPENHQDKKAEDRKITQNQSTVSTYQRMDIKRLKADLNARAEDVALHYLGQPNLKQGHTLRYGSNQGSLVITLQGAKQGLWRDFQLDMGGDMLGLIQHVLETKNFRTVLQEATQFLGGDSRYLAAETVKSVSTSTQNFAMDTQQKIQKAKAIYQGTQPITNTLSEQYLREHRGIVSSALADNTFRYHPNLKNWMTGSVHPALVIVARDEINEVCGIQAIFLDPKTGKKATQLQHQVKLSRGLIGEGSLIHRGTPSGKIALAEGPETALSIAEAKPDWTVYATFGVSNFTKVRLPEDKKSIVICADNDGLDSPTQKSIEKSAEKFIQRDIDVWIAKPQKPENQAKWDFNDALMAEGIESVKQNLAQAALYPTAKTQPLEKDFKTLLLDYVDLEREQSRLLHAMHSAQLKDPQTGKAASIEALAHAEKIQRFAEQMIQHSEIQSFLETKHNIKPPHIADRGGFNGIHERLQQGQLLDEDIHVLTARLRSKAVNQSNFQVRDRSRGGRGR